MADQKQSAKKPLQFKTAADEDSYIANLMEKFASLPDGKEKAEVWDRICQYMFAEDVL